MATSMLTVQFDPDDLKRLVADAKREILAQLKRDGCPRCRQSLTRDEVRRLEAIAPDRYGAGRAVVMMTKNEPRKSKAATSRRPRRGNSSPKPAAKRKGP